MGQERMQGKDECLDNVDQKVDENLSEAANGIATYAIVSISGEKAGCCSLNRSVGAMDNDRELNNVLEDEIEKVEVQHVHDQGATYETLEEINQGTSDTARDLVDGVPLETVVAVGSAQVQSLAVSVDPENKKSDVKNGESGSSKLLDKEPENKLSETHKDSCVIDLNCETDGVCDDGEKICRICHLSSESAEILGGKSTILTGEDLIQLGCVCKDELGIAHRQCAEAWFKLKGNRLCEICGETAKHVLEFGNSSFMEVCDEWRLVSTNSNSLGREGRCWRGQPFCNFLMACLVIAFVLPWFFRVNMF